MTADEFGKFRAEGVTGAPIVDIGDLRVEVIHGFFVGQSANHHTAGDNFFEGDGFNRKEFWEVFGWDLFYDFAN